MSALDSEAPSAPAPAAGEDEPGKRRSRLSPGRQRLFALLVGLTCAALLAELGARIHFANPAPPPLEEQTAPRGLYEAHPRAGFKLSSSFRFEDEKFGTNALGMRDRERVFEAAAPSTVRIAVIGDSFSAGVGVGDEQHYAYLLEEALGEALPADRTVEVWNFGVPHYGTEQSHSLLREHWEEVQPDLVVLGFFEGNDAYDDLQGPGFNTVRDGELARAGWAPHRGSPHNGLRARGNRYLMAWSLPGDGLLQRHSYAYRLLLRSLHATRAAEAEYWPWDMRPFDYEAWGGVAWLWLDPEPPPIVTGWEITSAALEELDAFVETKGSELVVLSIPARVSVRAADLEQAKSRGWHARGGMDRRISEGQTNARLRAILEPLKVPLVDLRIPLEEGSRREHVYYIDDSHWNAAGHRIAATQLGAALGELGLLPELHLGRLAASLQEQVPLGSAPARFSGGFRPTLVRARKPSDKDGRGKPGDRAGGPGGMDPRAGGKAKASEIPPRLVEAERLGALLPPAPEGWTRRDGSLGIEPLPAPREDVLVALASATYAGADGSKHTVRVIDTAGQPELDQLLRHNAGGKVLGRVPDGMLESTARIAVLVEPASEALLAAVDSEAVDALELALRPPEAGPSPHPTRSVGDRRAELEVPRTLASHLVDPAELIPALPNAPEGWEVVDVMPMYRPHDHRSPPPVTSEARALLAETPGLLRRDGVPWSAQVKQWYRGPSGSFALVLQDTGLDSRLLQARQARIEQAPRGPGPEEIRFGVELRPWSGGGRSGFRTCRKEQGLCKVVVPLLASPGDSATLARFNIILMGPPDAADTAYLELIQGLKTELLPATDR